jgi:hypothetical protein
VLYPLLFSFFTCTWHICHEVQLLHKLFIRGVNGPEKLLKIIKVRARCSSPILHCLSGIQNPVTDHLPANTYKIGPWFGSSSHYSDRSY